MPKIDLDSIEQRSGSTYPQPFAADMAKRRTRRFGPAVGFTDFGVAQVTLEPGGISSQRHWHESEDEFVVMIEGEAVLVEEDGETLLRPGDCASFLKGVANGHHLVNRSDADCVFIAVGRPPLGNCHYPDVDLYWDAEAGRFTRKDGTLHDAGR